MISKSFDYLAPTEEQKEDMAILRAAVATYAQTIETYMPAGADQTYALRKLREVAMWVNVGVTRHGDGSPR